MELISNFDFNILDFIQYYLKCNALDISMKYITMLGNYAVLWIVLALLLLIRKTKRKYGIMMLIALFLSLMICNVLIKPITARIRPFEVNEEIFETLLVKPPKDHSFPSGHTVASFAAVVILFHYNKKRARFWLFIALLIAFSRIYLYVHYPTDVIVGIILGIILGIISKKIYYFVEKRKVKIIFKKNNVFTRKYKEYINAEKEKAKIEKIKENQENDDIEEEDEELEESD